MREDRELGTVPNFTTAGHILRSEVFDAANEVCGGISITFHAHKGADQFVHIYNTWRKQLSARVPLNVHVIANKTVQSSLEALLANKDKIAKHGPLPTIILLAYYPVGRGTLTDIMPKSMYNVSLPSTLKSVIDAGFKIAFSEGLLPYFFSRPEIGLDLTFASRAEGEYSAYVDPRGRMSFSSFDPPHTDEEFNEWVGKAEADLAVMRALPGGKDADGHDVSGDIDRTEKYVSQGREHRKSILEGGPRLQQHWTSGDGQYRRSQPQGQACFACKFKERCATPDQNHYLVCKFAGHNRG